MFRTFLLWILILSACSAIPAPPQTLSPTASETQPPNPDGQITAAPPDPQNCAYQWAYQDLPELSSAVQQAMQDLQPEAQASAFAFGEDCVRADGSSTFLPMETDFNITLRVSDLNHEPELGEWIVKVMQVIAEMPPEWIIGPRPGRISLTFQSAGDEKNVTFYINQYQNLPPGLSSAEIFQQLQIPQ